MITPVNTYFAKSIKKSASFSNRRFNTRSFPFSKSRCSLLGDFLGLLFRVLRSYSLFFDIQLMVLGVLRLTNVHCSRCKDNNILLLCQVFF